MFYPVSSVDLILSSVDRNLVSGETKICNPSSNTTLIFYVSLVPKLGFEISLYADSSTIRIVNNTYIQG